VRTQNRAARAPGESIFTKGAKSDLGIIAEVFMADDPWRRFYAEEIRLAANVQSPAVTEAFARVPRQKFMGPAPWQIASPEMLSSMFMGLKDGGYATTEDSRDLYHNFLVSLDAAKHLNNGQPSALARWIDLLELKPGDSVYHLGCGVGYYTAIIAEVVGSGGKVAASEVETPLADRARENLAPYRNVSVYAGDGTAYDPGSRDAMLINAGVTHPHPLWLKRLKEGGRILLPLTSALGTANAGTGVMVKIMRRGKGFAAEVRTFVGIYSCTSLRDPELNTALTKALATKALLKLTTLRIDPHEQVETCLAHGATMCWSSGGP
jgi:protein-L-isoaspartate(D-aspartate) O-methyltransferase